MTEAEAIIQAVTDPENQPSQYGTVTIEYHEERMLHWESVFEKLWAKHEKLLLEVGK